MTTKEQVTAALKTVQAITETIQELGRIPEGHLYAVVMGKMDLDSFRRIIDIIISTKLVKRTNHELIWIGPKAE